MQELKDLIPDYAKDIRLNLGAVAQSDHLNEQQLWGTWLASAIASREPQVITTVEAFAKQHLSEEALRGAHAAAAIMGMNNIYYRFLHLASNKEYGQIPARLRMQVIGNPGVEKVDFELWSLAVSAIHGCGMCIDSHEKVVKAGGLSAQGIHDAVRIASVVHATARVLEAERLRGMAASA